MSLTLFVSFLLYASITAITPGPNNILVLNAMVHYGFAKAKGVIIGVYVGFCAVMVLCGIGSNALSALLPSIMVYLKYGGALYIFYLSYKVATSKPSQHKDTSHDIESNPNNIAPHPTQPHSISPQSDIQSLATQSFDTESPSTQPLNTQSDTKSPATQSLNTQSHNAQSPSSTAQTTTAHISFWSGFILQFINIKIILYGITIFTAFVLPFYTQWYMTLAFIVLSCVIGIAGTSLWVIAGKVFGAFLQRHYTIANALMALALALSGVQILLH